MKKISIVIIDDQTLLRQGLTMRLNNFQHFKVIKDSCFDDFAICVVNGDLPDIILVNFSNPFANISDTLQSVQAAFPESKIILILLNADPDLITKLILRGIKGFLNRNSSQSSLTNAILDVSNGSIYRCPEMEALCGITGKDGIDFLGLERLSRRELQIAKLLAGGLTSKEIGCQLLIAYKTVEVHRHNIFKKLKIRNIAFFANLISMNALTS